MIPMINGRAYDWAQLVVRMSNATQPFYGIKGVKYSDNQEIENNYGAGSMPTSRGYGNYTAEGSMTLSMEEIERLQASVSSGRLQDIPEFDVVVSFVSPQADRIVTHTLRNCKFMNNGRDLGQGSKEFEMELKLNLSHIDWNGNKVIGLEGGIK